MPPPLTWTDLPGRKIGVWGVGVEGRAALRKLRALGVVPVLVDDAPATEPVDGLEVLPTVAGGLDALLACDVVIKSPGISVYGDEFRRLAGAGVRVAGALDLWLSESSSRRVVGVVGTKGKSTTASILGALLTGLGYKCFVGGNLGVPPYDPAAPDDADYWVIEISSFQVKSLTTAPRVVALTSLHPDHLDWHRDAATYFADKLSICSKPGAGLVVANGDDELIQQYRHLMGDRVRWVHAVDEAPAWIDALGLLGSHNVLNALIARACLDALGVEATDESLLAAAGNFKPLESRLRLVGRVDGVDFLDDSLSTNVLPTIAALSSFEGRRVALLVGGMDRGIEYGGLAEFLNRRQASTLVLALPQNGDRIASELRQALRSPEVEIRQCSNLVEAVPLAHKWSRPEGVVLLSPAAPSFGLYRNYRDRAEQFLAAAVSVDGFEPVG
ncbi:UDP-N-acetylmuramoyl-L-alanine--D-glutamate ligase [soil metagenome]